MPIRYGAVLPISIDQAFDFVSNPANWPSFFQRMESAEAVEGWGAVGGRPRWSHRIFGQDIGTDLVLLEWNRPHSFRYVGHNHGRADTDNSRVFEVVPGGTRLTGTTTAQPQPGLSGWLDRVTLLAARRVFRPGDEENALAGRQDLSETHRKATRRRRHPR